MEIKLSGSQVIKSSFNKCIVAVGLILAMQSFIVLPVWAQGLTIEDIGKVSRNGVRHVNVAEAQKILEINSGVVILDVRTPGEFNQGRLENAINVNYYSFSFKRQLAKLDRDKTYLIHCQTGVRSGRSIPIMLAAGFKNIIHMDGGYKSWKDHGLPLAEE